MTDHPLAVRSREHFRATWEDGDPSAAIDTIADDIEWRNDIGAGPLRALHGKAEVVAMFTWWTEFFEGTFHHELLDVCASDRHVIQMLREVGTKDGHVFDNVALYVHEVDARDPERFSRVQTFDRDRSSITEFWTHYPETALAAKEDLLAQHLV